MTNDHTLLNLLVVITRSDSKKFLTEPALLLALQTCLFVNAYLHEPAACVIGLGTPALPVRPWFLFRCRG